MTLQQAYNLGFQKAAEHYEAKMRKSAERRAVLQKAALNLPPDVDAAAYDSHIFERDQKAREMFGNLVGGFYGRVLDSVKKPVRDPHGVGKSVGNAVNAVIGNINNAYRRSGSVANGLVDGYNSVTNQASIDPELVRSYLRGLKRVGTTVQQIGDRLRTPPAKQ